MRSRLAFSSRFFRFLPAAATLLAIACTETTAPAIPTKLAFTVQPAPTTAGAAITPAVAVAVQDAEGNTIVTGGVAYCWGANLLGDGTTEGSLVPVPVS